MKVAHGLFSGSGTSSWMPRSAIAATASAALGPRGLPVGLGSASSHFARRRTRGPCASRQPWDNGNPVVKMEIKERKTAWSSPLIILVNARSTSGDLR